MRPRFASLLMSMCVASACSAHPSGNQVAQARPAERCADVRAAHERERAGVLRRIREMQAEDDAAERGGRRELQRQAKFMDFQMRVSASENRYKLRLADCSGS